MENPIDNVTEKDEIDFDQRSETISNKSNYTVYLKSPYKQILFVIGILLGIALLTWMIFFAK